jgi:hypothetical protein
MALLVCPATNDIESRERVDCACLARRTLGRRARGYSTRANGLGRPHARTGSTTASQVSQSPTLLKRRSGWCLEKVGTSALRQSIAECKGFRSSIMPDVRSMRDTIIRGGSAVAERTVHTVDDSNG